MSRLRERRRSRSRPSYYQGPGIVLGRGKDGLFTLPWDKLYETHVAIQGPTGRGKSYLTYAMAVQAIEAGLGLCVIDPHSALTLMLQNHAVQRRIDPKRLVVINPLRDDYTLKMNPLQSWGGVLGSGTSMAMQAACRVAGETDFERTPRLRRYLRAAMYPLEYCREPMSLLPWLCATSERAAAFRMEITRRVPDEVVQLVWEQFADAPRMMQNEHLDSSINRIIQFADDERLRRMMTYAVGNLDWHQIMHERKIVLVNLGSVGGRPIDAECRRLLGCLILHGILQAALRRPRPDPRFLVCCDEFGELANDECARGFDACRKFGVTFVVCFQRREQLEAVSPNVLSAVDENCGIKLVFGGVSRTTAEVMAKEVFTGEVDGEQVKYAYSSIAFRPTIRWVDILSHATGGADMIGGAEAETTGSGWTSSSGGSRTLIYTLDGIGIPLPDSCTYTDSYAQAYSGSSARSSTSTWASTRSWQDVVTRAPLTVNEEFLQPEQRVYYSLDEQWERKVALLKNLPKRALVVKIPDVPAAVITTLDIAQRAASPEALFAYETAVLESCPWAVPARIAEAEFQARLCCHGLQPLRVTQEPTTFEVREETTHDRTREDGQVGAAGGLGLPRRRGRRRPR